MLCLTKRMARDLSRHIALAELMRPTALSAHGNAEPSLSICAANPCRIRRAPSSPLLFFSGPIHQLSLGLRGKLLGSRAMRPRGAIHRPMRLRVWRLVFQRCFAERNALVIAAMRAWGEVPSGGMMRSASMTNPALRNPARVLAPKAGSS